MRGTRLAWRFDDAITNQVRAYKCYGLDRGSGEGRVSKFTYFVTPTVLRGAFMDQVKDLTEVLMDLSRY